MHKIIQEIFILQSLEKLQRLLFTKLPNIVHSVSYALQSSQNTSKHIFVARVEPPFMQEVRRSACAAFERVSSMKCQATNTTPTQTNTGRKQETLKCKKRNTSKHSVPQGTHTQNTWNAKPHSCCHTKRLKMGAVVLKTVALNKVVFFARAAVHAGNA